MRFVVRDLPRELPKFPIAESTKLRSFHPVHEPLQDNYAHSEIGTFTEGIRVPKPSLGKQVTKEFQAIMRNNSLVLLVPEV